MLLDERRNRILQFIEQRGFVSLPDLCQHFGISESTARRDVEFLDGISQVRKTRGGATYVGDSISTLEERKVRSLQQKQEIAQAVADMIRDGDVVLLDGGTTTLEVARLLVGRTLQVVTNSIPIINLLINQPSIELIAIGGYVYPKTGVALGPVAVQALRGIQARRLVMSVGGITERGLYNSNTLLVETERQMIDSSDEIWVVTDSTKFGHSALSYLCALDTVDRIITDDGITEEWQARLEQAGIEVVIVGSAPVERELVAISA